MGYRLVGLIALGLTACTAFAHPPGTTVAQHHADLEVCRYAARLDRLPPVLGFGPGAVEVAVSAMGVAASEIGNFQAEQRIIACMEARGYRHAGLTFRRDGWQP